jgi:hypothetical protein
MAPQVLEHPGTRPTETESESVEERPHGCYEGWVYLGFEGEDESGEPVEVIERVPYRRFTAAARR